MGLGDKARDMTDKAKEKLRGRSADDDTDQQAGQASGESSPDEESRLRDQAQETGESVRDRTRETFDR
jgi:hypothetical protein